MCANPGLSKPDALAVGATLVVPRARSPSPLGRAGTPSTSDPVGRSEPSEPAPQNVMVQKGQTLGRIAALHAVSLSDLQRVNGLSSEAVIYPGQALQVPPAGAKVRRRWRQSQQGAEGEARRPARSPLGMMLQNAAGTLARWATMGAARCSAATAEIATALDAGKKERERREEPRQYTVRQGDSIVAVAAKYKVDERRMQLYNGLRSENLHEGQTLFVDPPKLRARAFRHTEEFAARSDFVAGQSHGLRAARRTHRRTLLRLSYADRLGAAQTRSVAEAAWAAGVGDARAAEVCHKARRLKLRVKFTGLGMRWAKLRARQRAIAGKEMAARTRPRLLNPCVSGFVSSPFGMRWGRMHSGVDLAAEVGTDIRAAQDGVVRYSGWRGGYGKLLEIEHANGYRTRYAHCDSLSAREGQPVRRGQRVATVGQSGRCEGPHLHFEVRKDGVAEDPEQLLRL